METTSVDHAGHTCIIDVSMGPDPPLVREKWFDIWAAAVEIHTLCVLHGYNGTVENVGKFIKSLAYDRCFFQFKKQRTKTTEMEAA